jgi:hypothetical protein
MRATELKKGQVWEKDGRTRRIVDVNEHVVRWATVTDQEHVEPIGSFRYWIIQAVLKGGQNPE